MIDPKTASFVDTCAKAKNTLSVNVTCGRKSLCRFETTKIKTAIWVFMLKVNTRSSEIKGATHRPFTRSACNFYEPETNMLQKAKVYSRQSISNREQTCPVFTHNHVKNHLRADHCGSEILKFPSPRAPSIHPSSSLRKSSLHF